MIFAFTRRAASAYRPLLIRLLGLVIGLLFLAPLLWSAVTSVAPLGGTSQTDGFGLGNYQRLVDFGAGLPTYLANTVVISALTVAITLTLTTLGGYAFARFNFPGKNVLFVTVLAILMVPYASLLIPLYVVMGEMHLTNSLLGLSLVLTLYQLPFGVFMMRVAFESVPSELEEAAIVDGAGPIRTLFSVMLPAALPGLITVGLYTFLAAWNDFIAPLIFINDSDLAPLPLALASLRQQSLGAIDYGATQAGVIVLALPCVALFLLLQRFYVRGFLNGAVKG